MCWLCWSLIRGSRRESASKLIQVVSRIQFLMVWVLGPPLPCQLSTKGHSLFLKAACILVIRFPPSSKSTKECQVLLTL